MPKFIEFAYLHGSEAYPVMSSPAPLFDDRGREVGYRVDHRRHLILVSPSLPPGREKIAIRNAVAYAERSAPVSMVRVPLRGSVE